MNAESFYARVMQAAAQPPTRRHADLLALHHEALTDYTRAVEQITADDAARPVNVGTDARTLGQIVGHFVAWDRFSILAAGDILAGVEVPRSVLDQRGFVDTDGQVYDFDGVDAFNDWQAARDRERDWAVIQAEALDAARTFYTLYADPALLHADRLERTRMHLKRLHNGETIPNIRMGWVLWLIQIQHLAVEHAVELNLPT